MTEVPQGRFLVNYKSNDQREGDMLLPTPRPATPTGANVSGVPMVAMRRRFPRRRADRRPRGLVAPRAAGLPAELPRHRLDRFCARTLPQHQRSWCRSISLPAAGVGQTSSSSACARTAPRSSCWARSSTGDPGTAGIDYLALLVPRVPPNFDGYLWTNRIEIIGKLKR